MTSNFPFDFKLIYLLNFLRQECVFICLFVCFGLKIILFTLGQVVVQMSAKSGPGLKEGKVLKGEGIGRFKGGG